MNDHSLSFDLTLDHIKAVLMVWTHPYFIEIFPPLILCLFLFPTSLLHPS